MKAEYDSKADALSIDLVSMPSWEHCEKVGDRVNVATTAARPVNVEVLYASQGIDEPLWAAAERFALDAEALVAAARAALAVPDRAVTLGVAARTAA